MLYEFKGYSGQIEVYQNKVVIKRNGFARLARSSPWGEKEIALSSIMGIQVKRPGQQKGYIKFVLAGSQASNSNQKINLVDDENTVLFLGGKARYNQALLLKQRIEDLACLAHGQKQQHESIAASGADELIKLKKLLDAGVISNEEFTAEKSRLLKTAATPTLANPSTSYSGIIEEPKSRKGFGILAIISFVLAIIYLLFVVVSPFMLSMVLFFGGLGAVFQVLSKSPKASPYLFGKESGIKKSVFVPIGIILSFVLCGITMDMLEEFDPTVDDSPSTQQIANQAENQAKPVSTGNQDGASSLSDITKWYEAQMPGVSQALLDYAQSVQGLTNMNVQESKFRFGENGGYYDCHYTLYFTCKINGDICNGEARAFLKYGDNQPSWFHFEIFRESDWVTMVEHYDDTYDQILEDYYKQLIAQYN